MSITFSLILLKQLVRRWLGEWCWLRQILVLSFDYCKDQVMFLFCKKLEREGGQKSLTTLFSL